jgi:hypothetical protein
MLPSTAIRRQADGLIPVDFDVQGNDLVLFNYGEC